MTTNTNFCNITSTFRNIFEISVNPYLLFIYFINLVDLPDRLHSDTSQARLLWKVSGYRCSHSVIFKIISSAWLRPASELVLSPMNGMTMFLYTYIRLYSDLYNLGMLRKLFSANEDHLEAAMMDKLSLRSGYILFDSHARQSISMSLFKVII